MRKTFFEELNNDNATGVAYKNISLKKSVLAHFANVSHATIAELCKELNLSTPKITAILNDMIEDGIVKDYGKVAETKGGRKPNLFGLLPDSAFFLGVDVGQSHISIALSDLQKKLIKVSENIPYNLENNIDSLESLCKLITNFITTLTIPKDKILGIGINLSGRVNYATGYSYSFFNFSETPLSKVIESKIGVRVFLENDSRSMAFGELNLGVVKDEKNILFVNMDYGLGLGVIINGQLYYGKSGYSGEFGHMPIFNNEQLCHCGKKGCLETEAAGWALIRMFNEKIQNGSTSILFEKNKNRKEVNMNDIINAANNDDVLSIELIGEIGEKIGRGIALLINLFNPELIILGGRLATTGEYIRLPIKSAIHKYSLSIVNNDTQIKTSELGARAGILGACLLVRQRVLSLNA